MAHKVTLIPGDGTGPEVAEATQRVIDTSGAEIEWEIQEAGLGAAEKYGNVLPDSVLESIRRNKVALKGPITTPRGGGFRSVNVALRKMLDLYACLRPCKWYPGVRSRYEQIDLVVVRENHEDLYAGIEFEKGDPYISKVNDIVVESGQGRIRSDAAVGLKVISQFGSERVIRYAFEYARRNGRKQVNAVAKDNIMKFTDGLFFAVGKEVAKDYPEIHYEETLVDAMCMQLVTRPEAFDVLVLPNLYGDVLSDLCAGLVGGLGVAPGANMGDELALFEPIHGSAPRYAGQNKVNPVATILSGMLMLRHLGEAEAADKVERATAAVIAEGKSVTYDMKQNRDDPTAVGTSQMADAIIQKMKEL